jgi:hypothetical protein
MEPVQTARHPQDVNPPSFESVWAILQEVAKSQKELNESQKKTERIIEKNAVEMGRLSKRMGEVVEYMVAPNLRETLLILYRQIINPKNGN